MTIINMNNVCCNFFIFVLMNVRLFDLYDYKFFMIVHTILCLNERETKQKKETKKTPMHKNGQILGLTFNVLLGIKPFASS